LENLLLPIGNAAFLQQKLQFCSREPAMKHPYIWQCFTTMVMAIFRNSLQLREYYI